MRLRIDGLLKVVGAGVPLLNVTFEEVGLKSQCRRGDLLKLRLEIGSLAAPLTGGLGRQNRPRCVAQGDQRNSLWVQKVRAQRRIGSEVLVVDQTNSPVSVGSSPKPEEGVVLT